MTKPASQPPHPLTAVLILLLGAGLLMMLILDGAGHTVGIGMVIVGAIGLVWRKLATPSDKKRHVPLHTSGADRGKAKKH